MLQNYQPDGASNHPENSAYLLPSWLWVSTPRESCVAVFTRTSNSVAFASLVCLQPHASSLDAMERRGASCASRLSKVGRLMELDEAEKEKIRESGLDVRNVFEGINDEIEEVMEREKERRNSMLIEGSDFFGVGVAGPGLRRKISSLEEENGVDG